MEKSVESIPEYSSPVLRNEQLLAHWQGHRALTRRTLEQFPEESLFSFSLGGMRPFSEMIKELLAIAGPGVRGIATQEWQQLDEELADLDSKEKLLTAWDNTTKEINEWWPRIPQSRFQETVVAFEQYESVAYNSILYFIDNEIHHRAQGFVYLRSLGLTPPNFWER